MAYVTYSSIAEASRTLDITNNTIPWSNDRYFNIPESVEGTTAAERAAALLANSPSGTTALNSLYFGEQHNGGHEVFAGNLQRRNEVRRTALANLRAHLKTTGRTLKQVGRTPLTPSEEQHNTFSSSPSQSGSPRNLTATGSNAGTLREVTLQDLSIDELFMVYDAADDEDGEDAVVRQLSEAIGLLFTSNATPRDQSMEMLARLARNFPAATRTVQASNLGIVASSGRGRGGVGNNNSLTITIRPIIVKPAETLLCRTMRMQKLQKGGGGGGGGHAQQPHSGPPHTQNGRGDGAYGGGRGGGGNFLPQVPNYQQQQQHQPPMPFPHNNGLLHNPPHGAMPQNPTPFFNVPPRLQQQQQHQQQQQSQSATVKQVADKHLTDCPNAPLKALWAALTSPPQSPAKDASVALEIINDGRCGLERMSTEADGPFTDQLGYTLNEGPKRDRIASPLKLAIFSQRQDIVAKIVDLGANVNGAEEGNRDTPLHVAAGTNNTQLIEYLVSKGAKVNTANKYGNTPLHRASANGQLQAIEKLLALGADKTLGGDNTPLRRFEEFHAKCKATDAEKAKIRDLLR
eukprot:GILJ01026873.1.p1 GENE.GILJ01026873.1~~GILJ01026873.1.p1  ORF type:complete len:616 (-),score=93.97 GILJ01026873.1:15-1736(-)